jgi:hypothetical protein
MSFGAPGPTGSQASAAKSRAAAESSMAIEAADGNRSPGVLAKARRITAS